MRLLMFGLVFALSATPLAAQDRSTFREASSLYHQLLDLWKLPSIEARRLEACSLKERAERLREQQRAIAQDAESKLAETLAVKGDSTEAVIAHVKAKVLMEEVARVNGYAQAMCFTYGDEDLRLAD